MMTNHWFTIPKPNPTAQQRLFCFPYAGGSSTIFRQWVKQFPPTIEVCLILLPGRERRLGEPLFTDIIALAEAIAEALIPHLNQPFSFFGHSLGAITCFEVTRALRRQQAAQPNRLLVSGSRAPHMPRLVPAIYHLPKAEFIAGLKTLGGTPAEVWQYPELVELFLPVLRADLTLSETYLHSFESESAFNCPITAFGGWQDPRTNQANLKAWAEHTTANFSLHMFQGGHFFPWDHPQPFLAQLAAIIES